MATDVIMPQLGESIAEGTIVKWLKKVGDPVKRDEDLLVVSTDKVEAELPAPASGTLMEIKVPEGKTVAIKTVIAIIGDGAVVAAPAPSAAAPAPVASAPASPAAAVVVAPAAATRAAPATPSAPSGERHWYSPLVKKIAKDEGISAAELERLAGSGHEGRVTKRDVLAYVENRGGAPWLPWPQLPRLPEPPRHPPLPPWRPAPPRPCPPARPGPHAKMWCP